MSQVREKHQPLLLPTLLEAGVGVHEMDVMKGVQTHRASFFMLTPLPGSRDHKEIVEAGHPMDSDYNRFDSFHETMCDFSPP